MKKMTLSKMTTTATETLKTDIYFPLLDFVVTSGNRGQIYSDYKLEIKQ